ncbi:hypothetical protein B7P43_G02544 [Cryptotermes secundus]|uniref:Uncharacterized protein n=1 Tax=Cryptotermes secundus TaxID=105785 RepID=A0A2J7RNG6_9NEOP|nr:hypothetical protein B7P43_G02544 [Cryptotermes secundus]
MLNTKPEGNRRVGRPRLRWEECVWQDIRAFSPISYVHWSPHSCYMPCPSHPP